MLLPGGPAGGGWRLYVRLTVITLPLTVLIAVLLTVLIILAILLQGPQAGHPVQSCTHA